MAVTTDPSKTGISETDALALTGTTLAPNVVNASLNSITPSGGLLDVQGSVWAKLPSAQNTTLRGLRFGIEGSATVYGGSEMNLDTGEVRHTAGYAGYGGYHTWYANGNLKATLNDTGLYLFGTQTITGSISATGQVEGATLRVNVTPRAEVVEATHTAVFNINGTNYKFLCLAA